MIATATRFKRGEDGGDRGNAEPEAARQGAGHKGAGHHHEGVHDVVGADHPGLRALGRLVLDDGVERHGIETGSRPRERREGRTSQGRPETAMTSRRPRPSPAGAGKAATADANANRITDIANAANGTGRGVISPFEPTRAQERTRRDADRKHAQEKARRALGAAEHVPCQRGNQGEDVCAERPEPGDAQDRRATPAGWRAPRGGAARVAENVERERLVRHHGRRRRDQAGRQIAEAARR